MRNRKGDLTMPKNEQKLTGEELQKIDDWIKAHCKEPFHCQFCGQSEFQVQATAGIVPLFGGGVTMLGSGYPAVVVICSNCGNMLFLNAVTIGVVPAREEDTPDAK